MTLSFSTKWPAKMGDLAGQPNYFIEKILKSLPGSETYYPVICPRCNWKGMSSLLEGGGQIADTGDYGDTYCPRCGWWNHTEYGGVKLANNGYYHGFDVQPKIHTIRSGNRWRPGMKIHPVINNRTKNRFQFAPVLECKSVQEIEIIDANMLSMNHPDISYHSEVQVDFSGDVVSFFLRYTVKIDGKVLNSEEVSKLAINDGFPNADAFFFWFDKDFQGQIVSWVSSAKY